MSNRVHTAPPGSGDPVLGKTLPELLYDVRKRYPNPRAFNQPDGAGWRAYSTDDFATQAEETALGLRALGLERGDKVALLLKSDVHFCIADMGCLIAGLVDVPIYLSQTAEQTRYVIEHSEAKALFVADREQLAHAAPILKDVPDVKSVIVAEDGASTDAPSVPDGVELLSMDELRKRGREEHADEKIKTLLDEVDPGDLATLIYTSGTTGQPKGVMLTHENISFNAVTSINCLTDLNPGAGGEVALSFLPLTHIYARALDYYGFLAHGISVYFCEPDQLTSALPKVQPTVFNSVPRLIEKVYASIQKKTGEATGAKKAIGSWALDLAGQYRLGEEPGLLYKAQAAAADALVFKKWRAALGGRVKYITVGGAALNAHLANSFAAAGIRLVQGYGLTETSPVISFNRPDRNRAGTVGEPIPGVEVKIAEDGEILTRGPHVMQGYYKNKEKTDEVLTEDGWFHTGDIGEFTPEGFLRITDRKKDLFKLSTGKYITPSPLESRLSSARLVEQVVVVGTGHKYCGALIFPDEDALRSLARDKNLDAEQPLEALIKEKEIIDAYQRLVDEANEGMDPWSTIKRFALVPGHLTIESGLLTPTMKVKRSKVHDRYEKEIEEMYAQQDDERRKGESVTVS